MAGIEKHSNHAVAHALVAASPLPCAIPATAVHSTIGGGIQATVDGRNISVGSVEFMRRSGTGRSEWVDRAITSTLADGASPVLVSVDCRIRAVVGIGDALRHDTLAVLRELRARGHATFLLSGDHTTVAQKVGEALEFDREEILGGVSPEKKREFIEALAQRRATIMVGDGVNDAAALARATVGIAVQGGAEASLAAADVFATSEGIRPVLDAVDGAHRTIRVIHRNLALSLGYNAVGVALAITGTVGPLIAAILMPLSSITVVLSSYRSRTFAVESRPFRGLNDLTTQKVS